MEIKEKDEQKTKKIVLLILAIFVMLAAVTLTTYAFFNYSRTGTENNQLITGRIKLLFEDGTNNINLTNQFPMSDAAAVATTSSGSEIVFTDFTVSGYAGASIDLYYEVYALAGEGVTGKTRMPDEHIKLYLTASTNNYGTATVVNGFDTTNATAGTYGALISVGNDGTQTSAGGEVLLAQGQVGTENTIHTYTMRMWISDTVTISDTDSSATYCASTSECSGSRPIFSDMYYSLKLRVQNMNE